MQGGIGTPVKLRTAPKSGDLDQTIQEYVIPSREDAVGQHVPLSPTVVVDPASAKLINPFNWNGIPLVADPPNPAAGANFTYTIPAGRKAILYGISFQFTTSAAVANRTLMFRAQNAAGAVTWFQHTQATNNQTANRTNYYWLYPGLAVSDAADQVVRTWNFPAGGLELKAGEIISTLIGLIDAADQVGVIWRYKETDA